MKDCMNERMTEWTNKRTNEWVHQWVSAWAGAIMNERKKTWTNECMIECLLEWLNKRTNEWVHQWENEWVSESATAASGSFFLKPTGLAVQTWDCSHVHGEMWIPQQMIVSVIFAQGAMLSMTVVQVSSDSSLLGWGMNQTRIFCTAPVLSQPNRRFLSFQATGIMVTRSGQYSAAWKLCLANVSSFALFGDFISKFLYCKKTCFTSMPFLWLDDCIRGIGLQQSDLFQAVC
jgi:hypothetical protein